MTNQVKEDVTKYVTRREIRPSAHARRDTIWEKTGQVAQVRKTLAISMFGYCIYTETMVMGLIRCYAK